MSLLDVPVGQLAAVVTYLEMNQRPDELAIPHSPLTLVRIHPAPHDYRTLFRAVGAPWLWFSRLIMRDSQLRAIIDHPAVELFEVRDGEETVGMLELDRRGPGACELSYVGLIPAYAGQGHGRWLLAETLSRAWTEITDRVHVHTCSLDHPAALTAYRRAGFIAIERKVEIFLDPRLAGILPLDSAPHIPLVGRPLAS
ncbi:MAG: GNAT family N-acetyltransferase [Pseudomonadota bacterium]|nr:GNAT family N-acetyltransferase [Pseudomonadota bacterium]